MTTAPAARGSALPPRRVLALLALVAVLLWLARPIVGPFLVAAAVAYAFSPLVDAVEERVGLSRPVVVIVGYVAVLAVLALAFVALAGPIGHELAQLVKAGPEAVSYALRQLVGRDSVTIGATTVSIHDLASQLQDALLSSIQTPGSALHVASQAAEVALNAILAVIVTFYFLLDGRQFRDAILRFLQPGDRARAMAIGGRIHAVLGRWLRGQLFLVGLVAMVVYLVLGPLLHVPYSSAIGVLTGVLEVVPLVGPVIAVAIAAVVAFSAGGAGLAGIVIVVYFVLRQVEDQVVMPIVIGRAVHLHPVVTIFAVLVGLSAYGVLGGLLAVPVAAAVNVALHEFYPDELSTSDVPPATNVPGASTEPPATTGTGAVAEPADGAHFRAAHVSAGAVGPGPAGTSATLPNDP